MAGWSGSVCSIPATCEPCPGNRKATLIAGLVRFLPPDSHLRFGGRAATGRARAFRRWASAEECLNSYSNTLAEKTQIAVFPPEYRAPQEDPLSRRKDILLLPS